MHIPSNTSIPHLHWLSTLLSSYLPTLFCHPRLLVTIVSYFPLADYRAREGIRPSLFAAYKRGEVKKPQVQHNLAFQYCLFITHDDIDHARGG